jgi:predicted acylesterase/phospholipase RssA
MSVAKCKIWEAARATSAASGFFDPITIGLQEYVDGATGHNNPVEVVFSEAQAIWKDLPSRLQCIVSIGTGITASYPFGDDLRQIAKTLVKMATETEVTEKRFYKSRYDDGLLPSYFRFNVTQGLSSVKLDAVEKLADIESATRNYLESPFIQKHISQFAEARPSQDGKLDKLVILCKYEDTNLC